MLISDNNAHLVEKDIQRNKRNPEKHIDIDYVQELSADKLVKNNHEMETDLQALITDFADFK